MKTRSIPTVQARLKQMAKKHPNGFGRLAQWELLSRLIGVVQDFVGFEELLPEELRLASPGDLKIGSNGRRPSFRSYGEELRALAELSDRIDCVFDRTAGAIPEDDQGNPLKPEQAYPHLARAA